MRDVARVLHSYGKSLKDSFEPVGCIEIWTTRDLVELVYILSHTWADINTQQMLWYIEEGMLLGWITWKEGKLTARYVRLHLRSWVMRSRRVLLNVSGSQGSDLRTVRA